MHMHSNNYVRAYVMGCHEQNAAFHCHAEVTKMNLSSSNDQLFWGCLPPDTDPLICTRPPVGKKTPPIQLSAYGPDTYLCFTTQERKRDDT